MGLWRGTLARVLVRNIPRVLLFCVVTATRIAVVTALKALEVVGVFLVLAMAGILAVIAVTGIETPVDMPVKPGALVPGTCTYKPSTGKPLRAVVTVRSAAIGAISVVAIGASRGYTDTNANGNLSLRLL